MKKHITLFKQFILTTLSFAITSTLFLSNTAQATSKNSYTAPKYNNSQVNTSGSWIPISEYEMPFNEDNFYSDKVLQSLSKYSIFCRVYSVHDGDTLRCKDANGNDYKVRWKGIDSPELQQLDSRADLKLIKSRIMDKQIQVVVHGLDSYQRVLGTVFYENQNLNQWQLAKGMAFSFVFMPISRAEHIPYLKGYLDTAKYACLHGVGVYKGIEAKNSRINHPQEFRKSKSGKKYNTMPKDSLEHACEYLVR